MAEKSAKDTLKEIEDRLAQEKQQGRNDHGTLVFRIADSKIVSWEYIAKADIHEKGVLT